MKLLKQSTAVNVPMGPFLDSTDGNTEETGLTISQADIRLTKNGAAWAQTNNAAGATHQEKGNYQVPLDTTDTNTLGTLRVYIHESGALAVWDDFMVIPANAYDSLVAGTDALDTSVIQWLGTAVATPDTAGYPKITIKDGTGQGELFIDGGIVESNLVMISNDITAANNLEADYDGTGYSKPNSTIGTCTTNADMRGTDSAATASALSTHDGKLDTLTTTVGTAGAGLSDLGGMSTGMKAEINVECDTAVNDYNTTAMTEAYAADGADPTPEQMRYMIWSALAEFAIAGTTITAKKLDGSATAMTFTLDDGTNPTSRTRAT